MNRVGVAIPILAAALLAQPYDLSPHYLQDGTFEAGYRSFKKGKWSEAEKQLRSYLTKASGDAVQPATYLLTVVLAKRARRVRKRVDRDRIRADRIELLKGLTGYEPLAGVVQAQLGDYYSAQGDGVAAARHYARVPEGGHHYLRTRVAGAVLAIEAGHAADALKAVEAALAAGPSSAQRRKLELIEARALAQTGRKETAIALLRNLWVTHHGKSTGNKAEKLLAALGSPPDPNERMVLAFSSVGGAKKRDLIKRRRALIRKYKRLKNSAVDFAKGAAASISKKGWKPALRHFARATRARKPFVRGFALYAAARVNERMKERTRALELYSRLASELPKHPKAAEALVRAARMARKTGDPAKSRDLLARLVKQHPQHPERVSHWWNLAWHAQVEGDCQAAVTIFDDISKSEGQRKHLGQATWGERALYWRGRCEAQLGQNTNAKRTYAFLVSRYPLTYYSSQAYNRLSELDPAQARRLRPHRAIEPFDQKSLTDLRSLRIARQPHLETAVALARLGLYKPARQELTVRARKGELGPDGLTLMLSLNLRQNRYRESSSIIRWRGTLPRYPDESDERLWKLAYPQPFKSLVDANAVKWDTDPWLLLSVIRHESAYNPRVVSRAGAVGLMQLMPATARSVSKKLLGGRSVRTKDLKVPRINIKLGSRLLKELLRHFKQNEALALVAYNAGSSRARRWLGDHLKAGRTATDALIEEIPFSETHSYVKSILASYGAYRYLYGSRADDANRSIPLEAALPAVLGPYFGKRVRLK
ncbi:MAG: soluble lytic murein transglycosylase [Myxococcota bacterium]|jgi:soluble lytic murein transglycosylase